MANIYLPPRLNHTNNYVSLGVKGGDKNNWSIKDGGSWKASKFRTVDTKRTKLRPLGRAIVLQLQ